MGKIILPNHQNVQYKTRKVKSFPHFFFLSSKWMIFPLQISNSSRWCINYYLLFFCELPTLHFSIMFLNIFWRSILCSGVSKAYFSNFFIHFGSKCLPRVACIWPKCLCSRGQESGREGCQSHQLFNICFLWHEKLVI